MIKPLKNILIIRTDRMGDVVLTTPVFKALRKAYPEARISALVTPSTYDLVNGNPYVDEVFIDDRKGAHKDLFGFLQLAHDIRERQFDAAFIFHTKRRYNLACYAAGVPIRVGYKNNKFGILLTHPVIDTRHRGLQHEAQYCLDVLAALGIEDQGLDLFVPAQKEAEVWAAQWFEENHLKPNDVIAIHPSASDPTKCWPTKSFADLIQSLSQRYQLKVVLVGGKESVPLAGEIMRLCAAPVLDMSGRTNLAQTVALLRRCRLLISNDSGPVHVAAATGIHVISLFLRNQPGINPERWKPLGPRGYVLANKPGEAIQLDAKGKTASGKFDSITVEEVLDLIEEILRKDNQPSLDFS